MTYPNNDIRYDSPLYIRELQKRLRDLSFIHPSIPRVNVDGIFGSETAQAVAAAQRLFELTENETADYPTWTAITAAHRSAEALRHPSPIYPFATPFLVLEKGDSGGIVQIIQVLFNALTQNHTGFLLTEVSGVMDEPTVRNVRELQTLFSLPSTGDMDVASWNALAQVYNASPHSGLI